LAPVGLGPSSRGKDEKKKTGNDWRDLEEENWKSAHRKKTGNPVRYGIPGRGN